MFSEYVTRPHSTIDNFLADVGKVELEYQRELSDLFQSFQSDPLSSFEVQYASQRLKNNAVSTTFMPAMAADESVMAMQTREDVETRETSAASESKTKNSQQMARVRQTRDHSTEEEEEILNSIIVEKPDDMRKSTGSKNGIKVVESSGATDDDKTERKEEARPVATENEAESFFKGIYLRSKKKKSSGAKSSNVQDVNTDSGTLSNVESVPNSPAREPWQNAAAIKKVTTTNAKRKAPQFGTKRAQEIAASTKRKLGHVNAQAMPVYVSKTAVAKPDDMKKSTGLKSGIKFVESSGEMGKDKTERKEEELPVATENEAESFFNSIYLRSKKNKSSEAKSSNVQDVNTDSDGTLSNVESVPNSPAREPWQNAAAKKIKLADKCVMLNSAQNNSRKRNASSVMRRVPTTKNLNTKLQSASNNKQTEADISSEKGEEPELRYYIETLEEKSPYEPTVASEKSTDCIAENKDEEIRGTPWLRHYERPTSTKENTAKNRAGFEDNRKENSSSTVGNSTPNNIPDISMNQSGQLAELTDDNHPSRKRGRPRKQDTQVSDVNPKRKKKCSTGNGKRKGPAGNTVASGSRLTLMELDKLFFKYFQDGHFRVDPMQKPIIIYSNDLHQNFASRIQCYDPNKCYLHPSNTETKTTSEIKTDLPPNHDANRFGPSRNFPSGESGHRMGTMNPDSQTFATQTISQTAYSKNDSQCGYTNPGQGGADGNGFNEIAHMHSVSNYMQSGHGAASSYQQNYLQNNGNITGINTNNSDNELNIIPHTQHQNSKPYKEMDLSMNNGTVVSSNSVNSMQNSPTNNITNTDWNNVNSALDSVSSLLMDLNSMNHANRNQAAAGSPDLNDLTNNTNFLMNGPNPWTNMANNMMHPRFPMMQPWRGSFPMYNPYLNNDSQYFNNIFNPYSAYMGYEAYSNNMNARNGMGINSGPWAPGIHSNTAGGHSNFHVTNPQFFGTNSGSLQENTMNQGMNLSLSSDAESDPIVPQTNTMELDDRNRSIGQGSGLTSSLEQVEGNMPQIGPSDDGSVQQSPRDYDEQICLPYSLGYKNDTENLDFDEVDMVHSREKNADDQREENQPEMQDYLNQRLANFEGCFNQEYGRNGSESCEIATELTNNREAEMSKLRQELVNFTRQYSEPQTSLTSQVPQEDEIFDCIMPHDLDTDGSSTS